MNLSVLYRGPLSSCNYGCEYCPFAKHAETRLEHTQDARALERFVEWVAGRKDDQIGILFTPWGEALIRKRYQQALVRLTTLPNVTKAAIQTNLSCRLDWVDSCDKRKLALWTTYHPTQITRQNFVSKCRELRQRGVRFSVGIVGLNEQVDEAHALRHELPDDVYVWVNAYKREPDYYSLDVLRQFEAIDPLFPINTRHHPSLGRDCRTGHSVISVDGNGTIRRCHFIKMPIGNIYEPGFEQVLQPRKCTNATCGCHIGYVHMDYLKLDEVFAEGILERIPAPQFW